MTSNLTRFTAFWVVFFFDARKTPSGTHAATLNNNKNILSRPTFTVAEVISGDFGRVVTAEELEKKGLPERGEPPNPGDSGKVRSKTMQPCNMC